MQLLTEHREREPPDQLVMPVLVTGWDGGTWAWDLSQLRSEQNWPSSQSTRLVVETRNPDGKV